MLARIFNIFRYTLGGGGLYLALGQLHSDASKAAALASLTAVGFVGIMSFVSHVLLHKQDAKQIGFKTDNVSFQFEVGFANLAFGAVALISYFAHWGLRANTVLLLSYALYLFQAAILHAYTARVNKKTRQPNLIRAGLTFLFSGTMLYIVIQVMNSGQF
jgi:hypothetical protein